MSTWCAGTALEASTTRDWCWQRSHDEGCAGRRRAIGSSYQTQRSPVLDGAGSALVKYQGLQHPQITAIPLSVQVDFVPVNSGRTPPEQTCRRTVSWITQPAVEALSRQGTARRQQTLKRPSAKNRESLRPLRQRGYRTLGRHKGRSLVAVDGSAMKADGDSNYRVGHRASFAKGVLCLWTQANPASLREVR